MNNAVINDTQSEELASSLALRLKTETSSEHERMHQLMEKADVFANLERYAQFTLSQYYFQQEIEHLFEQEGVADLIPDLEIRGRSAQALLDLKDLGVEPQGQKLQSLGVRLPEALGWIYVSEGSTLGAAFLFREAQKYLGLSAEFAARNLAAYPEGRAKVWRRFVEVINEANFDESQQHRVVQGALDAFAYFGEALINLDRLK